MLNEMIDDSYINSLRTRNKQSINVYLENFKKLKSSVLHLDGDIYNITEIPDEIKTYEWCTKMIIDGTLIENCNSFPPNITCLDIFNNRKLKKIDASLFPHSLLQIKCFKNKLEEIYGLNEGIDELILAQNEFKHIKSPIPKSVTFLDVSCNSNLTEIPLLYNKGENIRTLKANGTSITSIDDLHDNITSLHVCKTNIITINKLPANLMEFKAFHSPIESINCDIPESIVVFDVYNNNLIVCPKLGKNIKDVDLGKNNLVELPEVSPEAEAKFDIDRNDFIEIEVIKKFAESHPYLTIVHSKFKRDVSDRTTGSEINITSLSNYDNGADSSETVDIADIDIERLRLFQRNTQQFSNRHPMRSMFSPEIRIQRPDKYKIKLTKTFKL